jgi:hypothetical protein
MSARKQMMLAEPTWTGRDWVNFWERVAARQDGSRRDGVVAGMVRRRIIQFENAQSLHASVTDKEIEEQEMMMDKQQELLRREKLAADGEYHERRTAFEEGEKEGWLRSLEEEADTNREWFVGEDQESEEHEDDEEKEDEDAWRERDSWFKEKKAVFDRMEALVMGTTEECINLRVAEYEKEEVQFTQRRGEQFLKDMEAIDEEMLEIAGYMSRVPDEEAVMRDMFDEEAKEHRAMMRRDGGDCSAGCLMCAGYSSEDGGWSD